MNILLVVLLYTYGLCIHYVIAIPGDAHSDLTPEMQSWCTYVSSISEPEILMYNMIPKTSSSAVRAHVGNRKGISHHLVNSKYYLLEKAGDLDTSPFSKPFEKEISDKAMSVHQKGERLFVGGHFTQHIIPLNHTVEAFNTVRKCQSRLYSHLHYDFFSCPNAQNFRKRYPKDPDEWITIMMWRGKKEGFDPWGCAESIECLNHTFYKKLASGFEANFLSGGLTSALNGNVFDGAIKNLNTHEYNQNGFVYVGIQERIDESLEVFQCLYPSYFGSQGHRKDTNKLGIVNKRNNHENSTKFMSLSGVQELISKVGCTENDDRVYQEVERLHNAKYDAIKRYPELCCRKD